MKDLTNMRFGRLKVLRRSGTNKWGNCMWECVCDCGNLHTVCSSKLIQGKSRSCGCLVKEERGRNLIKHNLFANGFTPRTCVIWNGMKARCYNPKSPSYKNYGAKGIRICDEWLTFENFHNWAMENGYAEGLQIDRIDNSKGYFPDNCRWVTVTENMRNQTTTRNIEVYGIKLPISAWCKELHISKQTAYKNLDHVESFFKEKIDTGEGKEYFINLFLKQPI